jgi:hypothetical protein
MPAAPRVITDDLAAHISGNAVTGSAVGRLPLGQDERQWTAPAVGREVDLAAQPAPRPPEQSGFLPQTTSTPDTAAGTSRHCAPVRNRQTTPSNCSRNRPGYGPNSPIGR